MQAETILMSKEAAQAKLAAVKQQLRKRHAAEIREQYSQLEAGYAALAKGTPLINPLEAIRKAGWKEDGSGPRLAISRADQATVRLHCTNNDWWHQESRTWRRRETRTWVWEFHAETGIRNMARFRVTTTDDPENAQKTTWDRRLYATVPLIPPDVMPARGVDRSKHVILWEVDDWKTAAPDPDPMLLQPIGGGLYAVVAQWDLTPLEIEILKSATEL